MIIYGSIIATIIAYLISAALATVVVLWASNGLMNRGDHKLQLVAAWLVVFFIFVLTANLTSLMIFHFASLK